MYSDVFRMYPRARVGKPSDTIKIQHARCEYKRILAHEGSMTLRYKVPYTIQARYKHARADVSCCILLYPGVSQRRTGRAMCEGVDTCIVVYSVCILMYSILCLRYMQDTYRIHQDT